MRPPAARVIKIYRPHASKRESRQGIISDELGEFVPT
jgi:hypothetical protein